MNMDQCPKYMGCSAPLCPLDPDWRLRAHNNGDRVCLYLRESVKAGAEGRLDPTILVACRSMANSQDDLVCAVRKMLKRAAEAPSKLDRPPPPCVRKAGSSALSQVRCQPNSAKPILHPT